MFTTLKKENGRSGDDIFATLLTQIFADGDDEKIKNSLWDYLKRLNEGGHLAK